MSKLSMIVLLGLAASLVPAVAVGGRASAPSVSVTTLSSTKVRVKGSLAGARASGDSEQVIGCKVRYDFGYCYARNAAGQLYQCSASSPGFMAAAASVGPASYVLFDIEAGACVNIEVSNDSQYLPATGGPVLVQP